MSEKKKASLTFYSLLGIFFLSIFESTHSSLLQELKFELSWRIISGVRAGPALLVFQIKRELTGLFVRELM